MTPHLRSFLPPLRRLAALTLSLGCAAGWTAEPSGTRSIYQQRLPDGRILLTDQPGAGAPIQRTWTLPVAPPADPGQRADIEARRAASQAEAEEVSERIRRQLERQRQLEAEAEIERLRREQALATLAAERERAARERAERENLERVGSSQVVFPPGWHSHPHRGRHGARPPWRPPVHEVPPERTPEPRVPLSR